MPSAPSDDRTSGFRARPYLVALGLLWILPAIVVGLLHLLLPDDNPSGQCEGLGFGCTLTPSDGVLFLGFLAAPWLIGLGLLTCLVIAVLQARRQK